MFVGVWEFWIASTQVEIAFIADVQNLCLSKLNMTLFILKVGTSSNEW